jgi:hypothetical protein
MPASFVMQLKFFEEKNNQDKKKEGPLPSETPNGIGTIV